ncbi:TPA: hypothetical protein DCZ15_01610 [Candidatus Falkowbacteria bacterium]|nr:MAG: hypothetical protein UV95_C0001G0387 [Candidatus Falkowbacteria bacterium GW2011_GWF2_43_32]HBA36553.1 hypothetical protein [Candidatus Falkowbacteria bacterium]
MADDHQKKNLLMWVVVIGLTVLILAVWFFNLKNIWRANTGAIVDVDDSEWQKFKMEWRQATEGIGENLETFQPESTSTPLEMEREEAIPISESPADTIILEPSKPAPTNCPEYINCMPTVGTEPRPCNIPPGCEDITVIAY